MNTYDKLNSSDNEKVFNNNIFKLFYLLILLFIHWIKKNKSDDSLLRNFLKNERY